MKGFRKNKTDRALFLLHFLERGYQRQLRTGVAFIDVIAAEEVVSLLRFLVGIPVAARRLPLTCQHI